MVCTTHALSCKENVLQVKAFLERTENATLVGSDIREKPGRQMLPGEEDMDGFYYAVLVKQA